MGSDGKGTAGVKIYRLGPVTGFGSDVSLHPYGISLVGVSSTGLLQAQSSFAPVLIPRLKDPRGQRARVALSTLLGLLSDLAVLEDEGFPFFILGFQEAFLGSLQHEAQPMEVVQATAHSAPGQSSA